MATALALTYRPDSFEDTTGQNHVKVLLQSMVRRRTLPPVLVFQGSRGTGKTTTARVVAAALNCDAESGDACNACVSCKEVRAGRAPYVLEIDAASNGTIEEVRKIQELCLYDAGHGAYRVVILDEAHMLSIPASNALLKIFEEPPLQTLFILCTTEPGKILPTIRSRAMDFEFRRLTEDQITSRLRHIAATENMDVTDEVITAIATRAQGGMRDAVMTLDQATRAGVRTLDAFNQLMGAEDCSVALLDAAARDDLGAGLDIIEAYFYRTGDASQMVANMTRTVRDLLVLKAEGAPPTRGELKDAEMRALAGRCSTTQLIATIRVLWDLKSRTKHTDNDQRIAMEQAFILILAEYAKRRDVVPAPGQAQPTRRLSLSEMSQLASGG